MEKGETGVAVWESNVALAHQHHVLHFAPESRVLALRRPDARWGDDRRHRTETRDRKMTRQFKNHPNSYSAALGRAIL